MKKAGGERCVDLVEEFEKQKTNAISIGQEPIATRVRQLFYQTFGTQLPQFITKCTGWALFHPPTQVIQRPKRARNAVGE